ncbi:SDR family NAD(P)-dependent oxidoreductase [Chondromyces apiculatus]|uniref:Short-chain dehydrogenase/reductase SDR n=1 Tax=Chondromyces apiculatus DSM 436 TaxID=1192034 RepID=A0A017T0U6_9BACT|nr:SDR family oxidoreductase [Chondromyces apiculatus]EYF02587.1 short-chain dehydrogenase/reductase SDR [Chondromyces apiculatus DSM 436]
MAGFVKRVCLLTGAGGRLGEAFCRTYADQYDIVAVYRTRHPEVPSQVQRLRDPRNPTASVPDNEHPVFAVQADLLETGQVRRVVELALTRFDRVDVLLNAAADVQFHGPLVEAERLGPAFRAQMELNVMVPMQLVSQLHEASWRHTPDENRALRRHVLNVSSTSGLRIYTGHHQAVYSASKAALNYLTCHMADELSAIGVRANALAPNSFPAIVTTERVVEALVRLDEGDATGQVLELDAEGERSTR